MEIQMLDLKGQYQNIKDEIDSAIKGVVDSCHFINGEDVGEFARELGRYISSENVIPCANGTDALQIALMSLELKPGDEVILPAFTYAATAEVVALLGLVPVLADVDPGTFNILPSDIEASVSSKTRAVMPVHLFGHSADMEPIMDIAKRNNLYIIEDNAQALGARYSFSNGTGKYCGTIGHIGCTSFFPSKNLGCYGDGGAILTQNESLAQKLKMIANHGQKIKYQHDLVGCNSRLDTIQAAVLRVKLKYLNQYTRSRQDAANRYMGLLRNVDEIVLPKEELYSTHVYHQFTIQVKKRDLLKDYLESKGVPSMIYYPYPIEKHAAFRNRVVKRVETPNALRLANEVLSLPMHTELKIEEQIYVSETIKEFLVKNR
jgi:dTDP-4-amino-4,6-dideoxygalactose transaminase